MTQTEPCAGHPETIGAETIGAAPCHHPSNRNAILRSIAAFVVVAVLAVAGYAVIFAVIDGLFMN